MNQAMEIAARLNNDGQVWQSEDGKSLEELCLAMGSAPEYRDGHGTDTYRFVFPDYSVITVAGDGWDFGYLDCYCWEGAGHQGTECDQSPDYKTQS